MKGVGADIFEYPATVNSLVDVNRIEVFENHKTFWKAVKYQESDKAKTLCFFKFKALSDVCKMTINCRNLRFSERYIFSLRNLNFPRVIKN